MVSSDQGHDVVKSSARDATQYGACGLSPHQPTSPIYEECGKAKVNEKKNDEKKRTMVTLTEDDLSLALEDIFTRASKEVRQFTDAKLLDKIAVDENGILMCKTRIMEGQEMEVFGELANVDQLKDLASINFKVPLVDHHSSLAISLAYHFHVKFNHLGPNSTFRLSLGYAHVRGGKTILRRISDECVVCIKARKKYMEQVMAPIHGSQLSVTPIFYFTVMDSWGSRTAVK